MDPGSLPFELSAYFSAEDLARGAAKARLGALTGTLELALDTALLLLLTFGRLGARLYGRVAHFTTTQRPGLLTRVLGSSWAADAAFLALVALLRDLVALPLSIARDHVGAHALGLSQESLASFLVRGARETLLLALAFAVLGAALGAVRSRWPGRWWLSVGALAGVLLVADTIAEPLWLRLDYSPVPLPTGELRSRIEALALSQGADVGELVVLDASRYSTRANAFVTGLGPTRALLLTDTLVAFGTEAALGAAAHEVGHRRDLRLPPRLAVSALFVFLFLWLVDRALTFARRQGARSDGHAFPFVLASATAAMLLVLPIRAAFARAEEREADRVELAARTDYDAYIAEQVRLVRANASQPRPSAFDAWLSDHPCAADRIGLALWYKEHMPQGENARGRP